jgi:putative peptide zinc metalloprotease protein
MSDKPAKLVGLRPDLSISGGAPALDGSPRWIIQDPGRNQFFQIDWMMFEVLKRWSLGDPKSIIYSINSETTLTLSKEDFEQVLHFLSANQLLDHQDHKGTEAFMEQIQAKKQHWVKTAIHHYLFFRIPLVRPDVFLHYLLPFARPFMSLKFLKASALAAAVGLALVLREWDKFSSYLVDIFSWDGLLAYGIALSGIKVLHELGHALQAKRYGCKVPAMGLAFLVMWPLPYTDVNESWKLKNRYDRLLISSSGILTELCIAGWATLLWVFLPDGPIRMAAFVVATITWVGTLAINASPFMRFDGYFILSDFLDMPNLHSRSFAFSRWQLRRWIFLTDEPLPEEVSPQKKFWMIIFGFVTWVYRLIIFLGIAAMVYHFFFKALGLFLFVIEIVWFIALPILNELKDWKKRELSLKAAFERNAVRMIGFVFILFLILPLNLRVHGSGILRSAEQQFIVLPVSATVAQVPLQSGSSVKQGDLLFSANSGEIDAKLSALEAKERSSTHMSGASGFDPELRVRQQVFQEEANSAKAQRESWSAEKKRLQPTAEFSGKVVDTLPSVQVGEVLAKNTHVLTVIDDQNWIVEAYFQESEVSRMGHGYWAQFLSDTPGHGSLGLTVINIDKDATRVLPNGSLASSFGGPIAVRDQDGRSIPENAIYRVVFKVDSREHPPVTSQLRGKVVVWCIPRPYALDIARHLVATIIKESGW